MPTTSTSPKTLTDKSLRFCEEYLIDCNATQAAIRAGYSTRTAGQTGHENLKKPEIADRIHELMAARNTATGVTAQRVIEELAHIAFSRITDVMTIERGVLKVRDLSELTDAQVAAVGSIKPVCSRNGKVLGFDIRLQDKIPALIALLRHTTGQLDQESLVEAALPLANLIRQGLAHQRAKAAKNS